jgi:mevalonate kinase
MPAFSAKAPGKIILFGEHAVVYGMPAIAVPVTQVFAKATVLPNIRGKPGQVEIHAPDIEVVTELDQLPIRDPLGSAIRGVMSELNLDRIPSCTLSVRSTIPVASGLGSGTAVSVAIIRALAGYLGQPLQADTISRLAYEVEKIHHGTPSGIDNTVVAFAKPVYFVKHQSVEIFSINKPFTLVIGDTGIRSLTKETVKDVRVSHQEEPERYDRLFAAIGSITKTARLAIEGGYPERLGPLMDENHALLQEIGVSSPELDRLISRAKQAGALGAKLSGGGRGGNMIALTTPDCAEDVALELHKTGAINTIITNVIGRN